MAGNDPTDSDDTSPPSPMVGIKRVLHPVTTLHQLARPMAAPDNAGKRYVDANVRIETVVIERPSGPRRRGDEEPEPSPNFDKRLVVMQPKRGGGGPVQGIGSMQPDFKPR